MSYTSVFTVFFALMAGLTTANRQIVMTEALGHSNTDAMEGLSFSQSWNTLGPFRIGTREASWGSDPLEWKGGFRTIDVDENATFRSALGDNGLVSWTTTLAEVEAIPGGSKASLQVQFPQVDWSFLRSIYGWAALQHQAWTRGYIQNNAATETRISLLTNGILEFWINDDHHWGGDFYTLQRASVILTLKPGTNKLDIRLIHDVRAMGGSEPTSILVSLEAKAVPSTLYVDEESAIISNLVDGKFPAPFASVACRNDAEEEIEIVSIEGDIGLKSQMELPMRIFPGQSRPFAFLVDSPDEGTPVGESISITFTFRKTTDKSSTTRLNTKLKLTSRSQFESHKFTFLHPTGTVSYAILRPPSKFAQKSSHGDLPLLLNLHGAGLEADTYQVRHMLDEAPDVLAWALFPTGSSQWSADDWHTFGFADLLAAAEAIPSWIKAMDWSGPGINLDRWFVSGHSNGGQGTWFVLTHQPDKVFAAAPASGYTAIQNYVPYVMWQTADPRASSIIQTALSNFRHELLLSNFEGKPILQQHGSADDNVPAYHSRLMSELISQSSLPSTYVELAGKPHWWDGAMTTEPLKEFYNVELDHPRSQWVDLPQMFTISVPHSYDMGSRGGISVDQLQTPDVLGQIWVSRSDKDKTWHVSTSNIRRFHLKRDAGPSSLIQKITLDEQDIDISNVKEQEWWLVKSNDGSWTINKDKSWQSLQERHGKQIGMMDSILRTKSGFAITTSPRLIELAVQISRNFLQYFGADSQIDTSEQERQLSSQDGSNEIRIIQQDDVPASALESFPLKIKNNTISLRLADGVVRSFKSRDGMGAIFLRPLPNSRLELVIWGADAVGVRQAARLVPMLTGVGQADFVILGDEARWKGIAGVVAMGFFDYQWDISKASFIK